MADALTPDRPSDLSPAALRAYKRLVQYLYIHELEPGDSLPPQQTLRLQMKLTNDALGRAMKLLCQQGVLARKARTGTHLLDRSRTGPLPWTVGLANIAAPAIGPLSTFTTLAHHVQVAGVSCGWRVPTFYRFTAEQPSTSLDDFGELSHQLDAGALDGLVVLTPLQRPQWQQLVDRQIPVAHCPFWENAPCGLVVDQESLCAQAVATLASNTANRKLMVITEHDDSLNPDWGCAKGFYQGLKRQGLDEASGQIISGGVSIQGGQAVARRLLALPAGQRPDALIVLDDYIALGITQVLAHTPDAHGRVYHPQMAVQSNREVNQSYHLPVIRYEISLQAMAQRLIEIMSLRLANPTLPQTLESIQPDVCESHEATILNPAITLFARTLP